MAETSEHNMLQYLLLVLCRNFCTPGPEVVVRGVIVKMTWQQK